jgi:DNA polymerase phi
MIVSQAKEIISVVQTDPTLGFAFILQLTGVHGNQQFDKLTRTKTVESILTKMNAVGIKNYISHLMEHADGSPPSEQYGHLTHSGVVGSSPRARSDAQVINARRSWTIEQLAALIRNGAIPKSDDWVQAILDFFIVHGIFFVKKKSKKSPISAVRIHLSPPSKSTCLKRVHRRIVCRHCHTRTTYSVNAASVYLVV